MRSTSTWKYDDVFLIDAFGSCYLVMLLMPSLIYAFVIHAVVICCLLWRRLRLSRCCPPPEHNSFVRLNHRQLSLPAHSLASEEVDELDWQHLLFTQAQVSKSLHGLGSVQMNSPAPVDVHVVVRWPDVLGATELNRNSAQSILNEACVL
jgi:hypothetical protein